MPLLAASHSLLAMLARFEKVGGAVNLVAHDCAGLSPESNESHELVAREAISHFAFGWGPHKFDDGTYPKLGPVDRDTPLPGRRIDLNEMMGERYDARGLLFPTHTGALLPAAEAEAAKKEKPCTAWSLSDGFARAFADPPYPIQASITEIDSLFRGIWHELVGTTADEALAIMTWNTDAWDEFEDGRDWWGTFLYTVARRDEPRFVSIAASTTD